MIRKNTGDEDSAQTVTRERSASIRILNSGQCNQYKCHARHLVLWYVLPSPVRALMEAAAPGPSPFTACTVTLYTEKGCRSLTVALRPAARGGCRSDVCRTKWDTGPPGLRGGSQDNDNEVGVTLVTLKFSGGPDTVSKANGFKDVRRK